MNPKPAEISVVPASFAQQRLWFLDRFEPGSAAYHMPLAVRFAGPLDRRRWSNARSSAIAERHEALRTTFRVEDGEVLQAIHPAGAIDFRVAPVADEAALAAALAAEARRPFDLVQGRCGARCCWRAVHRSTCC